MGDRMRDEAMFEDVDLSESAGEALPEVIEAALETPGRGGGRMVPLRFPLSAGR